jgi:hypothetical protein
MRGNKFRDGLWVLKNRSTLLNIKRSLRKIIGKIGGVIHK